VVARYAAPPLTAGALRPEIVDGLAGTAEGIEVLSWERAKDRCVLSFGRARRSSYGSSVSRSENVRTARHRGAGSRMVRAAKARVAASGVTRYQESMKPNAKSSITLPADELRLVASLKARLRLKSNVEVVRRGLRLLQETTDRAALREAYRGASARTRDANAADVSELDGLADEGLD
jgi:Arc/MetJ-type ribon-helix-helix transcriptional regulator